MAGICSAPTTTRLPSTSTTFHQPSDICHRQFTSDILVDSSRSNSFYIHNPRLQCLEAKESRQAASRLEARLALMAARSNRATQARPVFRSVTHLHDHGLFSLCFAGFAHRFGIHLIAVLPHLSRVIHGLPGLQSCTLASCPPSN